MLSAAYRAFVKSFGLTPCGSSNGYSTLHQTRDNQIVQVPDPEKLTMAQRAASIEALKVKLGITNH